MTFSACLRILSRLLVLGALATGTAGAQPNNLTPEEMAYARFRVWVNAEPRGTVETEVRRAYREHLAATGLDAAGIDAEIELLTAGGERQEIEMWNRVLTAEEPRFNTEPNEFLVRMTTDLESGRALDVGMGQGRNAIWLAEQGWSVVGFDPADKAVALAERLAAQVGVTIDTRVETDETFDFGTEQWDLVVLSYVSARPLIERVVRSLRPGGVVVLEAFHDDATANASIGRGVVYDSNELLELFAELRVLRYEDETAVADFGRRETPVVRLFARKD